MKLEQKWYSAARGTLFAAVLLLCLAGGIRGGLGLVFLAMGVAAAIALGGLNAPSPLSQLWALHPAWFSMEETQYAAPAASTFLGSSTGWWEKGN